MPKVSTPKSFVLVHQESGLNFEIIKGGGKTWGGKYIPRYHWIRLHTPGQFSRSLGQFDLAADALDWITNNAMRLAAELNDKKETN